LAKPARPVYQARHAARTGAVCRLFPGKETQKDIMAAVESVEAVQEPGVRRRDFLNIAAVSAASVGGLALLYPLVVQMNPSADILALAQIDVDVSAIQPGQAVKTIWRKQPIFIRNLTPAEQQAANAVDISTLRDPATLASRTKPEHANWLITLGVCTHLGCVPLGAAEGENRGEFGGYFCPCHGSHYDTAARVRKGPAPRNLEVPEYEFTTPTAVRIG
jgi:ubiquinol-cytochrome c reductase iron-sulfur subunit